MNEMNSTAVLPRHVAVVMDGNGRWAEKRGLAKLAGHEAGGDALKKIVRRSGQLHIDHLTIYAFSTENWKRTEEEVNGIFSLIGVFMVRELEELHAEGVVVNVIGDYKALPQEAVANLEHAMAVTKDNDGLHLNIAINYGSRAEILMAARQIAEDVAAGKLSSDDIRNLTDEDFTARLYTKDMPDPDLVIRTSGEMRLSNYLLWQSAYSEFYFTDILWPDFDEDAYDAALATFKGRKRRFGGR
ncbi:MAG: isoprenyl transferase [Clostridiales Family XIII bacterium]|jgi:undecaprenyl diphosphate synthase|nr:isoprenyl transferase [Clostridiales Family XIII bacterium]